MLILEECRLAMSKEDNITLVSVNRENNKIGDKGC
jgi:hypothetical protein